ncbi:FmdB family zinc ribbon protein [Atopobium minutum]|uniref:Uncharacterized protein n=1 Tax=Atopobium minutum 10063974 TaxID=997872 RepID=N2BLM4_9ACTN|nr:hypothetical protein [Atopobium minutum]EMZ42657.1 hypothetical protein HMPREF1091_00215 [Atopobium minutum 10063974]
MTNSLSEQRQEVAERLRREASGNEILFLRFFSTALVDAIELNYKKLSSFNDTLISLADLIDPTCHDFGGMEGTNGEDYEFACSACGYRSSINDPYYCPHCGARVVSDDE